MPYKPVRDRLDQRRPSGTGPSAASTSASEMSSGARTLVRRVLGDRFLRLTYVFGIAVDRAQAQSEGDSVGIEPGRGRTPEDRQDVRRNWAFRARDASCYPLGPRGKRSIRK